MSTAKKVAGQSGWFLVGNLYTLFVGFTFQIYLARHIGAEGLGLFGLLQAGVGALSGLLGLGIAQVMVRFIPEHVRKQEYAELHSLVRGGFALLAGLGLVGALAVSLSLPLLVGRWPDLAGRESEVLAGTLMLPLGLLLHASAQALRGFYDIRYVVIGGSILQLTAKVLSSIIIFALGFHVVGYLWAVNLSMAVALVWMLFGIGGHLRRYPSERTRGLRLLPAWRGYAKVMYGNNLLGFWAAPLEKFILGLTASAAAVGVLVVANTLYMLPAVFLQMFLAIVGPMLAAAASENKMQEVEKIYHLSTDWLVRLSLPLIIFLAIFAAPLLGFYGKEFTETGPFLLQLLLAGQLLNLIVGPIGNVLNMCGRERKMFVINTASILLRAILLLAIVPVFGLYGLGATVVIVLVFSNASALIVAWKSLGLQWWDGKYKAWCLPSVLTVLAGLGVHCWVALNMYSLAASLPLLYLVFHGAYILIHGFNPEDREVLDAIRAKLPVRIAKFL